MKKNSFLFAFLFLLLACQQRITPIVSFYYWKTVFKLTPVEHQTLKENQVQKLYIRYFDIDLDSKSELPFPESAIHFEEKPIGFTIVPVVYIKNSVLLKKEMNLLDLAKKTSNYIQQINTKNKISCQEIQIDCDWTLSSRDNYLQFIEIFKKLSGKKLSATIRLHQIKYFEKTKIPNVDKGVLMYYNMGKIAPDSLHSIYDRRIANKYLASLKKYPLPIDIALPIYSWAIHIRDEKILGLKNKLDTNSLKNDLNLEANGKNKLKVIQDHYKAGTFYKAGDFLKFEKITTENLLEMASDLQENTKTVPQEIIFYDLDEFNIKQYEKDIFKQVSSRF